MTEEQAVQTMTVSAAPKSTKGKTQDTGVSDNKTRRGAAADMRLRRFEDGYRHLKTFLEEKKAYPGKEEKVGGQIALGRWLAHQCKLIKKNKLPSLQREALEQLPDWQHFLQGRLLRNRNRDNFDHRITALRAYVEKNDRLPRQTEEEMDAKRLAQWVNSMRKAYHMQRLYIDFIRELESVPHWSWAMRQRSQRHNQRVSIDRMLTLLQAFLEKEQRMPHNREEYEGVSLGTWSLNKRLAHRKGQLSDDLVTRLEALPHWNWAGGPRAPPRPRTRCVKTPVRTETTPSEDEGGQRDAQFEHHVALLDLFVREHFRLPVMNEKVDGFGLGAWCTRARRLHAQQQLAPERVRLLESIPMWQWVLRRKVDPSPTQ